MIGEQIIQGLAKQEREDAVVVHATHFVTLYDAWGTIREEVKETARELNKIITNINKMEILCEEDDVNEFKKLCKDTNVLAIKTVQEALQICATCMKAVDSNLRF